MSTPSFSCTSSQPVSAQTFFNFVTASLDPRITFTRAANTATRVNSSGYIESVNANVARFDYDPITLVCRGLLIEQSRGNSLQQSEALNVSPWNVLNCAVNTTGGTSPANTNTANLITDNATTGVHGVAVFSAWPAATQATLSVYVKAGTLSKVCIGNASTGGYSYFDLATGSKVADASGFTSTIAPAGNGWYRITATHTAASAQTLGIFSYVTVGNPSYSGSGQTFYAWGAQLEIGAFATSYIPTTTSGLTRNADVATITGANFSSWYTAGKGTFRVDAETVASGVCPLVSVDNNTAANSMSLFLDSTAPKFTVIENNIEQATTSAGTVSANTSMFAYVSYDVNYFGIARPDLRQIDNSGVVPSVDRLRIGANQAGNYANGRIQAIRFWP